MIFGFVCAVISYFGVIKMQRRLYIRGLLTEGSFVLFQVPVLCLLVLTGSLAFLPLLNGTIIGIALSIVCAIIGYPAIKWIYRQRIMPKLPK